MLAIEIQDADSFFSDHPTALESGTCSYESAEAQADCGGDALYLLRPSPGESASCKLLSDEAGPLAVSCQVNGGERVFQIVSRIAR